MRAEKLSLPDSLHSNISLLSLDWGLQPWLSNLQRTDSETLQPP